MTSINLVILWTFTVVWDLVFLFSFITHRYSGSRFCGWWFCGSVRYTFTTDASFYWSLPRWIEISSCRARVFLAVVVQSFL
jgi:hypothetical protein